MGVIDLVCEKQFSDLFAPDTNLPLRFDFYLPNHNLLIEYDGEGHFMEVNFSGSLSNDLTKQRLKRMQYLDDIKNQYAQSNQYILLRIPYWEFENIETILSHHLCN
jgi:hypothetical protein